ncbi:MAG: AAA family ATPase [Bacteroidia bacterium]|nr:AAA family ATPase [Bacteroidia bacterium]
MKILIFGASGSGTTTLGKLLSSKMGYTFLDADDFYWEKTDPPFTEKVPLALRSKNLQAALEAEKRAIISGSLVTWGDYWLTAFDLAIFLHLSPHIRLQRLGDRELKRYGDKLQHDPDRRANSKAFLAWAAKYDDPEFEGRSIRQHEDWIKKLSSAILRIEGDLDLEEKVRFVEKFLNENLV